MLLAETCIEIFGQFFGIDFELAIDAVAHIGNSDSGLLVYTKSESTKFLKEKFRLVKITVLKEHHITFLRFTDRKRPYVMHIAVFFR